jgi:hypothetical protein
MAGGDGVAAQDGRQRAAAGRLEIVDPAAGAEPGHQRPHGGLRHRRRDPRGGEPRRAEIDAAAWSLHPFLDRSMPASSVRPSRKR